MGDVRNLKMKINVRLAGLFRFGRFKEEVLEYPSGTRTVEVIEDLKLPKDVLGIILINGVHAGEQDVLKDGDSLSILPLLDGG
jgi:molybdopterin converting factor small subunit